MAVKIAFVFTCFFFANQVFADPNVQSQLNWIKKELESSNKKHENDINFLKEENARLKELLKARDPVEDRLLKLEELTKVLSLRTCEEYARFGITRNDYYPIDPDGPLIGNDPIMAYCIFTENEAITEIPHDAEESAQASMCQELGCFERKVEYKAPAEQLEALIQLSSECSQNIIFDCLFAPLRTEDIDRGWWEDKNGNPAYYFDGNHPSDVHVCACNATNTCADFGTPTVCNCDSERLELLQDAGKITKKSALPITAFKYGPVEFETQVAAITIGRLQCSGTQSIPNTTTEVSCNTWKRQGVYTSGTYLLNKPGENYPSLGHCQMDAANDYDSDFETPLGYVGKSTGPGQVYFDVMKTDEHPDISADRDVTYSEGFMSSGGGLSYGSGIFTAPVKGTYKFSMSALKYGDGGAYFEAMQNGGYRFRIYEQNGDSQVSYVWYWHLSAGNTVNLHLKQGNFYATKDYPLRFTGQLI